MTRPRTPQRDHTLHRANWRELAERAVAAIDRDPGPDARKLLGDLAAEARLAWNYPAPVPEGAVASPLPEAVRAWCRQPSAELRAALAPGVRAFADAVLQLLVLTEPGAARVFRRERADIDG